MDNITTVLTTLVFGSYLFTAAIAKWLNSRIEKLFEQVFNHSKHDMEDIEQRVGKLESDHATEDNV